MLSSMGSQSSFAAQSFANQANLAMTLAQSSGNLNAPAVASQDVGKVAQQYTGMFMSQMFTHMFEGVGKDTMFGGGEGEEMFKSVLIDEYGKAAAKSTNLGLTDKIMHALIAQQEVKS